VRLEGEQVLLRIHLSNFVRWHGQPLYEALVEKARRERLSGATVLTGMAGYFGKGPLLGDHPFALQVERPVVLEIVEREEALDRFLAVIEPMLEGHPAIVTLERARVVHYRGGGTPT
jgi:hypothetical protein